jgi:hypothetical protein
MTIKPNAFSPRLYRRQFLALSAASAVVPWSVSASVDELTIWKSPTCGCCQKWAAHMRSDGFTVTVHDVEQTELEATKERFAVPENLRSCHTAQIDGYIIEGHVPASDVRLLLSFAPQVSGLAVPGMPIGSPGMEMGNDVETFATYTFDKNGDIRLFAKHEAT